MKARKMIQGLMVLVTLGAAGVSSAATLQCDGCTASEMYAIAEQAIYADAAHYPAYIHDFKSGVVRKYYYYNDKTDNYNPEFDYFNEWVAEAPVEQSVIDWNNRVTQLAIEAARDLTFAAGYGHPSDPFEAMKRPDLEDKLIHDIMNTTAAWSQRIADAFGFVLNPFHDSSKVRIPITVRYADGGTAQYGFNPVTKKYERIPLTSRDSTGKIVPDYKEQMVGIEITYVINDPPTQDDYFDMIDRLNRLGLRVVYPENQIGSGTIRIIECNSQGVCTITIY